MIFLRIVAIGADGHDHRLVAGGDTSRTTALIWITPETSSAWQPGLLGT